MYLLAWLLWSGGLIAASPPARADVVILNDASRSMVMGRHLTVLEDPAAKLGLAEVVAAGRDTAWADRHSDNLNFGYSRSAFWLHGALRNQAQNQQDWLLGLRYPLLDYLDIYVVRADGRIEHHASGDRRPFGTRDLQDRNFYFRLSLARGEQVQVYVRVQGQGSLQAPLEISTPAHHEHHAYTEQLLLGIYSGALLAMLSYNLMLGVSLRDRAYLFYVVYVGLFGAAQFIFNGLAFEYLWPDSPNWGNVAAPVSMGLAGWSLVLFSRQFLDLGRHQPRADVTMLGVQWLFLAVVPASFVLPYAWPIRAATMGTIVSPMLLLAIAAVMLSRGVRRARYFLAAFSGLLLGVLLTSLHMFGLVQSSLLTEYGMQIGSLLEFTLLSFALAHRLKLAREENEALQRAHAAELTSRVAARTLELNQAMSKLTEANQRLHTLSEQDSLTGLKNRMFLSERLPELWRHAQRWSEVISVLMIDVDHFKQVNDQHGHLAGDDALRQVAGVIARVVQRPGDQAVRYGGEEFVVVLPHTNTAGAAHMAEMIRQGVQALDFHFNKRPVPLTVSIGVASVVPKPDLAPQALLNAADQLLYQAKQSGRNRCAFLPDALAMPATRADKVKPGSRPAPASSAQS